MIQSTELKPTDIRYDAAGIWIKDQFTACDNPRLAFAKQLAEIPDNGHLFGREGSWIHTRVMYDPRLVKIGLNCIIGGCGFGYERDDDGKLWPIPHHGYVVLDPGVEIGNCACVDRGVIGSTVIGAGTKIDNLVHVAHGVKIGKNCLIVAGAVIGGSTEIGDNCFIGINASIKNKVKIGSGVTIGMGAVITLDVPDGCTVVGLNKIL